MDLVSFGITDDAGKRKTWACPIPSGFTDAQIQAWINDVAAKLDAVMGGVIADVSVSKAFTLPGGLKSSADASSEVRQGALVSFGAAGTDYRFSHFIPTWDEAGYTADTVITTGAYGTFLTALTDGNGTIAPCDKYENDLNLYLGGVQTFRK